MIQAFATVFGLSLSLVLLLLIRRDRLHISHGVTWGVAVLSFALLGFAPGLFDTIAQQLDIVYGPTLAISMAIAALVIKALLLDIECSKLRVNNQRLGQQLAIVASDLADLRNATKERLNSTPQNE